MRTSRAGSARSQKRHTGLYTPHSTDFTPKDDRNYVLAVSGLRKPLRASYEIEEGRGNKPVKSDQILTTIKLEESHYDGLDGDSSANNMELDSF